MDKTCFLKCPVDNINCTFYKSFLISILYTKNKISALMFSNQICI